MPNAAEEEEEEGAGEAILSGEEGQLQFRSGWDAGRTAERGGRVIPRGRQCCSLQTQEEGAEAREAQWTKGSGASVGCCGASVSLRNLGKTEVAEYAEGN